jgi:hypothetical protein
VAVQGGEFYPDRSSGPAWKLEEMETGLVLIDANNRTAQASH